MELMPCQMPDAILPRSWPVLSRVSSAVANPAEHTVLVNVRSPVLLERVVHQVADVVGDPAAQQQQAAEGERVGGDHPLAVAALA